MEATQIRLAQDVPQVLQGFIMHRVSRFRFAAVLLAAVLPWTLHAQPRETKASFECGPDALSPYGPLAECEYKPAIDLRGLSLSFLHASWGDALCFALRISGYEGLGKKVASSLSSSGQAWQGNEVSEEVTHAWRNPNGKNFRMHAMFLPEPNFLLGSHTLNCPLFSPFRGSQRFWHQLLCDAIA